MTERRGVSDRARESDVRPPTARGARRQSDARGDDAVRLSRVLVTASGNICSIFRAKSPNPLMDPKRRQHSNRHFGTTFTDGQQQTARQRRQRLLFSLLIRRRAAPLPPPEPAMPVVGGMELSEQDLAAFREVFDLVDKDGSGAIDAREVSELMSLIGMKTSPEEVDLLVSEIDADGNGEVDFEEFLLVVAGGDKDHGFTRRQLVQSFAMFADKRLPSGLVNADDLEAALVRYCNRPGANAEEVGEGDEGLTPGAAKALVAQLGRDENGNIDYLEKVNALMPR